MRIFEKFSYSEIWRWEVAPFTVLQEKVCSQPANPLLAGVVSVVCADVPPV